VVKEFLEDNLAWIILWISSELGVEGEIIAVGFALSFCLEWLLPNIVPTNHPGSSVLLHN